MYKLSIVPPSNEANSIIRLSDKTSIPRDPNNTDYQKFLQDYIGIGTTCVEGATVGVTTAYDIARKAEYPPIEDQLDKIYHSGVNAWKADIKVIKDKYPKTQVGVTTVAEVPVWVETEAYKASKKRLERYKLSEGIKVGVGTETVWNEQKEDYEVITIYATTIEPLPADDPAVIDDNRERADAQKTIDSTSQAIIDANS